MADDTARHPNMPTPTYQDVIIRAAQDPSVDIDKLERLVELQEAHETRVADCRFNEAMSAAQSEMEPVRADANNPQTKSRYAKYATLDRAIRPIYTKHGFAVSYNTEPSGDPNLVRVIALVTNGPITQRRQVDMPIVTQGFRGTDMMTRIHATESAITYGKRTLLGMVFNITISTDDDGNRAGGYTQRQPIRPTPATTPVDPRTGEVLPPHDIGFLDAEDGTAETWQQWGARLVAAVNAATTEAEIDQWVEHNRAQFDTFKQDAAVMFGRLEAAIAKHRNEVKAKGATKETSP